MAKHKYVLQLSILQKGLLPIQVSRSTIEKWIKQAMETDATITLKFVDEEEGKELNKSYRGKDKPTNILTFDYSHDPVEADLAVCVPVLEKEAKEQNKPLIDHLAHLIVHGVLHAHGYDHLDDEEAGIMEKREKEILETLGFPNPYQDA
ncbi:MAG: rRNA maturation RNase YbeY [Burkholderiales bacterium]|nr:rRNA maturation RNase YbeY [Burkholderiales bacterium]